MEFITLFFNQFTNSGILEVLKWLFTSYFIIAVYCGLMRVIKWYS